MTATTSDHSTAHSTAPLAWAVTLAILAGLVAIIVLAAFSQTNTPASIDGTTATSTQWEISR